MPVSAFKRSPLTLNPTMGLFYIWLKFSYPDNVYQRLITFTNRDAADEWWRAISTPPSVHAGLVKRVTPQVYVQTEGGDVCAFFNGGGSPDTRHVSERMLLAGTISQHGSYNGRPTLIIPPTEITDHISGQWYFIRCKADSLSHWYLRTSGTCAVCGDGNCDAIHVSSDYRTRFCVRVRDTVPSEDFVMIRKDKISIAGPRGYIIYRDDTGDLKATKGYQGEIDLLFGDLKNRFVSRAERQVNGEVWEFVESVERGAGEIWELAE